MSSPENPPPRLARGTRPHRARKLETNGAVQHTDLRRYRVVPANGTGEARLGGSRTARAERTLRATQPLPLTPLYSKNETPCKFWKLAKIAKMGVGITGKNGNRYNGAPCMQKRDRV